MSTTRDQPWRPVASGLERIALQSLQDLHVMIQPQQAYQEIEGFGGCLHERGWQALSALPAPDRDRLIPDLFAPGAGANLGLCRGQDTFRAVLPADSLNTIVL